MFHGHTAHRQSPDLSEHRMLPEGGDDFNDVKIIGQRMILHILPVVPSRVDMLRPESVDHPLVLSLMPNESARFAALWLLCLPNVCKF